VTAILTLVEHDAGIPQASSLQALTLGRRLAEGLDLSLHALVVGGAPEVGGTLGAHGASVVHVADHQDMNGFAPRAWARCVIDLVGSLSPAAVLAAGTDRGQEVMAHVAAELELPLVANTIGVEPREGDGPWLLTRQRWGGTLLEQTALEAEVKLLTVALHVLPAEEAITPGEATVKTFAPGLTELDLAVQVRERVERGGGKISLSDAKVVVGGGRGVGGADGFRQLDELAGLLGGVVGCSRAVTNAGWRPHADQIGQTGTKIAPEIYIACGISGATQHIVGARGAKKILVINTDADAPIMSHADYAVVGDLHQVVPAVVAEVRRTTCG
jgi:electron transfer flavoprotein alpha subunit